MCERRPNALRAAIDDCLSGVTDMPPLQICEEKRTVPRKKVSAALILAVVLLIAAATALAVSILAGWMFAGQREIGTPTSGTVLQGRLYYLSYQGLCEWSSDMRQHIVLPREKLDEAHASVEAQLFANHSELLALDMENQKIWRLNEDGAECVTDFKNAKLAQDGLRLCQPIMQNGYLWLRAVRDGQAEEDVVVYRMDLETGTAQPCWVKGVTELAAYGTDKLLALSRDVEEQQDRLLVLSANSGNVRETLYTAPILSIQGLATDEETNAVYATANGWLSCWNGAGWTQLSPFTPRISDAFYGVAEGGYVAGGAEGIQFQPFVEESEAIVLTIRGVQDMNDTDFTYRALHPDVRIARKRETTLTSRETADLISSGDTTDLFHIYLDADIQALFEDGLAVPLSDTLEADCAAMLPSVSDAIYRNGVLYAVPSALLIPDYDLRGHAAAPKPPVRGRLCLYIVNPNGQHRETALDYLAHMAQNRLPTDEALLKPQEAKPMLYPGMQEWLFDIEADQRAMDAEIGVSTDEAALQERLEAAMNLPDMWEVTQEALEDYRVNVAPYLILLEEENEE